MIFVTFGIFFVTYGNMIGAWFMIGFTTLDTLGFG